MLLEQVIEIIDFTDSDSLDDALGEFNLYGIVASSALPYLDIIFDKAPIHLCAKLKQVGFNGCVNISNLNTDSKGNCYAIYDLSRHSHDEAQAWLEAN